MKTLFIATTFYRLLKKHQNGTNRIGPGARKRLAKAPIEPG
jgi:hypothetical protein